MSPIFPKCQANRYTNNLLRPCDYISNLYKCLIILIDLKNVTFKLGLCRKLRENIAHRRR